MRHIEDGNQWDCIIAGSGPAGIGAAVAAVFGILIFNKVERTFIDTV